MKNCGTHFLLTALLSSTAYQASAGPTGSDNLNERAHFRAELRSALSNPAALIDHAEIGAGTTLVHEHQLSPQERADLRRQLREQFQPVGFDAAQVTAAPNSSSSPKP